MSLVNPRFRVLRILGVTVTGLVAATATRSVHGQSPGSFLGLSTTQTDFVMLTAQDLSESSAFTVDDATEIHVEVITNIGGVDVTIDYPGGSQSITKSNVHQLGGWYRSFEVGESPDPACLILPALCQTGYHLLFHLPSQGAGTYTVTATASGGLGGEAVGGAGPARITGQYGENGQLALEAGVGYSFCETAEWIGGKILRKESADGQALFACEVPCHRIVVLSGQPL